jgi:hypothetical protein
MRYLAVILYLSLLCAAHAQSPLKVELGIGQTHYRIQPDGVWYQLGEPHKLNTQSDTYLVGITSNAYTTDYYGVAWHADYVSLGHLGSWCYCTTDANYNNTEHAPRSLGYYDGTFSGTGRAGGVQFTLEPYVYWHEYRIGYAWGWIKFQPHWHETVYAWSDPPLINTPETVYKTTTDQWRLGHVYGFSVSRGSLTMTYVHYSLPTRWPVPALFTSADVLMVMWEF